MKCWLVSQGLQVEVLVALRGGIKLFGDLLAVTQWLAKLGKETTLCSSKVRSLSQDKYPSALLGSVVPLENRH